LILEARRVRSRFDAPVCMCEHGQKMFELLTCSSKLVSKLCAMTSGQTLSNDPFQYSTTYFLMRGLGRRRYDAVS
jgi:hypothetical protein